jgi:energy-coupling factor transporter ATP-binding protein EcfA2
MISVSDLYTPSFPLGPHISPERLERPELELLFDPENKLVNQLNHEKSVIVGRKGSGKTTLLTSVQILDKDKKSRFYYLPSSDLFAQIVREINGLSDGVVFVEQVGRLWDFVLWGVVFKFVASTYKDKDIASFCSALGLTDEQSPYEIISRMLVTIKSFPPVDWPLPEKIAYKQIGNLSFLKAKEIAAARLAREKTTIYLLLDSLEDFKLDIPSYGTALAGLLRCLGEFNEPRIKSVVLRCCLPAERYFDYMKLSTNPLKDFRSTMLLHWSAGELIHLSAVRYSKFLKEYYPDFYNREIRDLILTDRQHLEKFWNLIFPDPVRSRLNVDENPIAYIMRHTQLLPRHFIFFMNEIISDSLKQENKAYGIDSSRIRTGIRKAEPYIYEQIIEAYTTPLQQPKQACDHVLKELNSTFTWSDFDKIAQKVTKLGIPGASDRAELMRLLTEIGAVGRVVGKSERYWEGVFEYMLPNKLAFSEVDKFCIHPVFSEVCRVNVDYPGAKAIYTYWAGITDADLEHWMS